MDLKSTLEYLAVNAPEIGRLRERGDKLAGRVYRAYRHCYDHRTDVKAQNELITVVEDYIRRDLNIAAAKDLADRYGHKHVDDPIIIPDPIKVQHAVRDALRRRH